MGCGSIGCLWRRAGGVGKALMGAVMKLAKEKGVRRMRMVTLSNNIDAIRFYKKMGLTNFSVGLEAHIL
jgi:ribosomal protein S18 acetylase RimI-like enzyme